MSQSPPISSAYPSISRRFGESHWFADDDLLALAYAPDGSLWSVEHPGVLQHWDANGQMVARHELSDLESLWVFDARASRLASGADELQVFDVRRPSEALTLEVPAWITAIAFHPTGNRIATGHDDGVVRLWNLADPDDFSEMSHGNEPISALAYSSDGKLLAAAAEDRAISIWNADEAVRFKTLKGHSDRIPALAWKPNSRLLVSGGWDTTARLWNIDAGEPLLLLNTHADQVNALAFSPEGDLLAVADSAARIHLWGDVALGKSLHVLPGDATEIHALAFSADGQRLAVGGNDRVVHVWDPRKAVLIGGSGRQRDHRIALSGGVLVSTLTGTQLRCWDAKTGIATPPDGQIAKPIAVAASPDGRWIAITNMQPESRLHIWDNQSKSMHAPAEGPRAPITYAAFSADSKRLATCCRTDGTAWLWNPADSEPVLIIPESAEGCTVEAVAFHPNGVWLACGGIDWLATGGSNGAVTIWHIEDRAKVMTFGTGALALAFDSDGSRLAVAGPDSALSIFDTAAADVAFEIEGPSAAVASIAFSPDGRWLVAGCDDHTVRIWDSQTGQSIGVQELDTPILAVCFDPAGRMLYTGNGNTTCYAMQFDSLLES